MKQLLIAKLYPEIKKSLDAGFKFKEIKEFLLENNLDTSQQFLSATMEKIQQKKLLPKNTQLICFNSNKTINADYLDFAIMQDGIWYTIAKAIVDLNKASVININNIQSLQSPIARIKAKWILQEFQLTNYELLTNLSVTDEQAKIIENIHLTIIPFVNEMIDLTRKKYIKYIFSNLKQKPVY